MRVKLPISVYMITLNEEANIGAALNRVIDFDEVVIVDSGSSDRTLEIANGYPNVCTYFNEFPGFSEQKSLALSLCKNEWVLNLDADEIVTDEYISVLETTIREGKLDALESTRTLIRWGKLPRSFSKPERLIRFFRKDAGKYEQRRVHESISIVGKVGKVGKSDKSILHYENLTLTQRVEKSNRYSKLRALDKYESGSSVSIISVILAFPISFIRLYIFKGHFLDGTEGFFTCMNASFYAFMKYAKLWEYCNRKELGSKEKLTK